MQKFSFDFRKAFDNVPHDILCLKLKRLSVNPYIVNWIINFLSKRQQRVVVDGIITNYVDINRGVPQGTVLGPILFSIMVNMKYRPISMVSFDITAKFKQNKQRFLFTVILKLVSMFSDLKSFLYHACDFHFIS